MTSPRTIALEQADWTVTRDWGSTAPSWTSMTGPIIMLNGEHKTGTDAVVWYLPGVQILRRCGRCGYPHPHGNEGAFRAPSGFPLLVQFVAKANVYECAFPHTQVNNAPADAELTSRYPHRYWAISDKKTYGGCLHPVPYFCRTKVAFFLPVVLCSCPVWYLPPDRRLCRSCTHCGACVDTAGTGVLSKVKPLSITYDLPGHPNKSAVKGRIVTLEFETCYVIATYVTNAGTGLKVRALYMTPWP